MSLSVAAAQLQMRGAGESIKDLHLSRGDRQLAMLVLPVESQQAPP